MRKCVLPTSMPDALMRRWLAEFELVEIEVDESPDKKDELGVASR